MAINRAMSYSDYAKGTSKREVPENDDTSKSSTPAYLRSRSIGNNKENIRKAAIKRRLQRGK